jgi:hypothetical protein
MIRTYSIGAPLAEVVKITSSKSAHLAVQIPVSGDKLVIFDPTGNYYSRGLGGNIAFRDVTTEINNWLNYWKPTIGDDVYVSLVFSDSFEKTFASTNEYISWMHGR